MKKFLVVLTVAVVSVIVEGEGSSYCTTSAGYQQEPSLYLRVCCVTSNLGQTVHMRENNNVKIIVCPSVRLQSCPLGKTETDQHNNIVKNTVDVNVRDCKSWFQRGYTTSGVYTINPNGQTPFEVRG